MKLKINPRDVIEMARELARDSRDFMLPELKALVESQTISKAQSLLLQEQRMNLVMDCYLTGCAEMLKRLHGDGTREEFSEEFNHEKRIRELLKRYDLLEP